MFRFAVVFFICVTFCVTPALAQLPDKLKRCMPYPTLADEIRGMQTGMEVETPTPKVTIEALKFEGATHLSHKELTRLVARLRQGEFDADSDWIEVVEDEAANFWRDRGYFTVKVTARAQLLGGDSANERFSVGLHANCGRKYLLDTIRLVGDTAFPPEQLRELIPLRDGQVFGTRQIREGIDALTRLYGSAGYIDFTVTPEFKVDNTRRRISLTMNVDESTQFRVRKIGVIDLNPQIENNLRSEIKPGDVFNDDLIRDFYIKYRRLLPAGASPRDVRMHRDVRNGTVDLVFDFWTCPQP
ncbi:MAG: POTRA domain-containing protein [Candidatus Acidiferrales bacterium]